MSSNVTNEDLRSRRTKKALYVAIFSLLKNHSFKKITIKEICEEALISRATFYSHFMDKYDLLKHWMLELWPIDFISGDTYEQIEKTFNCYIHENMLVFKNLVDDMDDEVLCVLFDFILYIINITVEKSSKGSYLKNVVLSNFCAGGVISYFLWQVKNRFPAEVPPMNRCFYEIIHELQNWQLK